MPQFGQKSLDNLNTCDTSLIKLFQKVIKVIDCSIVVGHRSLRDQEIAFVTGKSKLRVGKHNSYPSQAVDAYPYPVTTIDLNPKTSSQRMIAAKKYYHFAGIVRGIAAEMGLVIRWGGDWDSDMDLEDQDFNDLVHFELV